MSESYGANDLKEEEATDLKERRTCGNTYSAQCVGLVVWTAILVGTIFMVWLYGPTKLLRMFLNWVPENPSWAWRCIYCAVNSISIVGLTPLWPPLCMGAGLLFGFWMGAIFNFISIYCAALTSFAIGRWLFKKPVRDCIESRSSAEVRLMLAVLEDDRESLKFQVLFRFLFIPMFIRNYAPATLEIPAWKLVVSAIPHSIWISILFASLGATFNDTAELVRNGKEVGWKSMKWQQFLVFCVALLVSIILSVFAWLKYKERLRQDEAARLT